ncbi:MAG TPA: sigma-54 dependent transcriptional regulator [Candidatus Competibacter sp.]|nr:sigma-54 dependent transcriptional regulator [Candidatus Competibacter sp.]
MESAPYSHHPVLVVDDDEISLLLTREALLRVGLSDIRICQDSRQVRAMLARAPVEILFLDLTMPHIGGEELLSVVSQEYPRMLVVILTATEDVETAVRCIKQGAFDYLTKPIDLGRLATVVKNALVFRELHQENVVLRQRAIARSPHRSDVFAGIVTRNPQMHSLFQYAETIAPTNESVLITGETGVGKDLLAQAIHAASGRRGDFVAVNVAGLDDTIFADTLFGHGKGAFTGAERARQGLVERAAAGTLLLDEIGDLTVASQTKLLRLLQEGDYFPLGQDSPRRSAARIISATNQDLWQVVKQGLFHKDLNYRLRIHHLHLPPLRERLDDLPLLLNHFAEEAAMPLRKPKPRVPERLTRLLEGYSFPGNIRELRMMVFEAVSRTTSKTLLLEPFERYIDQQQVKQGFSPDLGDALAPLQRSAALPTLKQATEQLVREALRRCNGNQTAAARLLGISQQAVSKRLKRLSP